MSDRQYVAFHEAGHAVAAFAQDIRLRTVTIEPGDGARGFVEHDRLLARFRGRELTLLWKDRLMKSARVSLAGEIAQRRAFPRSIRSWHGSADHNAAIECVLSYTDGGGEDVRLLRAHFRVLQLETEQLLDGAGRWRAVEGLADALNRRTTLVGAEAEAVIRAALRQRPRPGMKEAEA